MSETSETMVPTIDPAAVRERVTRLVAERQARDAAGRTTASTLPPSERRERCGRLFAEALVLGRPGAQRCAFCGAEVPRLLKSVHPNVSVWELDRHECAAGKAAAERLAAERLAFLNEPPEKRVLEIRKKIGTPRICPAGLDRMQPRRGQEKAFELLLAERQVWRDGKVPEKGVWLTGPSGAGKTCLMGALLFDVAHWTGRPVVYWNLASLFEEMMATFRRKPSRYDAERMRAAHVLVLDELPPPNVPDWAANELYRLVNERYDDERTWPVYVTGNLEPNDVVDRLTSEDEPERGVKIVRRLVEMVRQVRVRK